MYNIILVVIGIIGLYILLKPTSPQYKLFKTAERVIPINHFKPKPKTFPGETSPCACFKCQRSLNYGYTPDVRDCSGSWFQFAPLTLERVGRVYPDSSMIDLANNVNCPNCLFDYSETGIDSKKIYISPTLQEIKNDRFGYTTS
jgi:hypothetical protein